MTDIGFIGLGLMGAPMAAHLLDAGFTLNVYNRTRAKAEELLGRGAHWCASPAAVAAQSDTVITIVGAPADVEQVYFDGILDHARPGTLLIDMTTSSPSLAARLHAEGAKRGQRVLDAPVSGGQGGARGATLAIMVGGDAEDFAAVLPLLEKMGKKILHCGPAGSGQRMKLTNQTLLASNLIGVAEGLAFARKGGLDQNVVLATLAESTGASTMLKSYGEKIFNGDYAPGFMVDHFIKDMGIAAAEADALGLDLSSLRNALAQFKRLRDEFAAGADGIQAIARLYA
jgi:3-hydroxyisobutyrate dehydrogenase-like beta-hydroxyacid dehydrogenase